MMSLIWAIIVSLICKVHWDLSWLHFAILLIEFFFLLYFLKRFGQRFVFLELLALIAVTQWLFAPMVMDWFGVSMAVSYKEYFSYIFPGTLLYVILLTVPMWNQKKHDRQLRTIMDQLSLTYGKKQTTAIILFGIGAVCWSVQTYVPDALNYIFYFLSHFLLVAICLLIFIDSPWRGLLILGGIMLLIFTTLLNGMIGTVVFWLFIIAMIYTANKPIHIPYILKLLIFGGGLWLLATLQLTKSEYRVQTWDIDKSEFSSRVSRKIEKDPGLFIALFFRNLSETSKLLLPGTLIELSSRLNQGMLISYVMDYVPERQAYGRGEVTLFNTLTAFVPRMLWPQKPIVGQAEYYEKYSGVKLGKYVSSTLGPPGDAYADFGWNGVFFLALYGFVIGQFFYRFIFYGQHTPILLIWFMAMYVGSITVSEVSVAGYLNSVVKYLLFIVVVRTFMKRVLKLNV